MSPDTPAHSRTPEQIAAELESLAGRMERLAWAKSERACREAAALLRSSPSPSWRESIRAEIEALQRTGEGGSSRAEHWRNGYNEAIDDVLDRLARLAAQPVETPDRTKLVKDCTDAELDAVETRAVRNALDAHFSKVQPAMPADWRARLSDLLEQITQVVQASTRNDGKIAVLGGVTLQLNVMDASRYAAILSSLLAAQPVSAIPPCPRCGGAMVSDADRPNPYKVPDAHVCTICGFGQPAAQPETPADHEIPAIVVDVPDVDSRVTVSGITIGGVLLDLSAPIVLGPQDRLVISTSEPSDQAP